MAPHTTLKWRMRPPMVWHTMSHLPALAQANAVAKEEATAFTRGQHLLVALTRIHYRLELRVR